MRRWDPYMPIMFAAFALIGLACWFRWLYFGGGWAAAALGAVPVAFIGWLVRRWIK